MVELKNKAKLKNRYHWKISDLDWFEICKRALRKGIYYRDEDNPNKIRTSRIDSINEDCLMYSYDYFGSWDSDYDETVTDYYNRKDYGYKWAISESDLHKYDVLNEAYSHKHCGYVKLKQYFFGGGGNYTDHYVYYMEDNPKVGDLVKGERYVGVVTEVYKDDPKTFNNYTLTERTDYDAAYKHLVTNIRLTDEPKDLIERYDKRIAAARDILNTLIGDNKDDKGNE